MENNMIENTTSTAIAQDQLMAVPALDNNASVHIVDGLFKALDDFEQETPGLKRKIVGSTFLTIGAVILFYGH